MKYYDEFFEPCEMQIPFEKYIKCLHTKDGNRILHLSKRIDENFLFVFTLKFTSLEKQDAIKKIVAEGDKIATQHEYDFCSQEIFFTCIKRAMTNTAFYNEVFRHSSNTEYLDEPPKDILTNINETFLNLLNF